MPLKLQTDQDVANVAAERWINQYYSAGNWSRIDQGRSKTIHDRLVALGPTPDPAKVTEIIGNDSWSTAPACNNCGEKTGRSVCCGDEPDYESNTAYLCAGCLRDALALIEATP